jgi:hypothetical protein
LIWRRDILAFPATWTRHLGKAGKRKKRSRLSPVLHFQLSASFSFQLSAHLHPPTNTTKPWSPPSELPALALRGWLLSPGPLDPPDSSGLEMHLRVR